MKNKLSRIFDEELCLGTAVSFKERFIKRVEIELKPLLECMKFCSLLQPGHSIYEIHKKHMIEKILNLMEEQDSK